MNKKDPIRILHVLGRMNPGGVETWLMQVLRHIDRDRFRMDFLVHTTQPCAYDDEIRALGSKVIPCLHPQVPWTFARNMRRILREHGPYHIVHSHVHHFSGYVLRLAHQAGVPVRVAHSHNDTSSVQRQAKLPRRLYLALMKRWIRRHATVGLAASAKAASALFGPAWEADPRWVVLLYGIDLGPFRETVDSVKVRRELGIPADAFVVGHVGRFDEQKNHAFLVDTFAEVAKQQPRAWLLLVGDGPLRPTMHERVQRLQMADRVVFAGVRGDVPRLMSGAMDVFLLPSLYEGLGLVLIEAQAAGLRCVCSDVIPEEAEVVQPLVQRLSLSHPSRGWAEAIVSAWHSKPKLSRAEALEIVAQSCFDIQICLKRLQQVYRAMAASHTTSDERVRHCH